MTTMQTWTADGIRTAVQEAEEQGRLARPRAIAGIVDQLGRGGREQVAQALGITVGAVDQALRKARDAAAPISIPGPAATLRLLYAAELADLPPLTTAQWEALRHLARTVAIDESWIESGPGKLLAEEYAEAAKDGEVSPDAVLVETVAGWSRVQALAVLDVFSRDPISALPTRP